MARRKKFTAYLVMAGALFGAVVLAAAIARTVAQKGTPFFAGLVAQLKMLFAFK